ncbi:MAG: DNA polymerase III subunit gamma/tau, partial [Acidimicrobiales bacterium]
PYQSLYRRFRPQTFVEVRGQDHVTRALRNAVRDGHTTHAYLFSGARGTGKTSTARILAKALNCSEPVDGEPCGVCESCVAIAAGTSFDVHELDAASNNGVDAMRDLVARASLSTPGRWKVYIVDEVHMLSNAASNSLLKTLEEPPDHVVFVLATTDPQRVLPTIRSRTQHFEFHLIDNDELSTLVNEVAKTEGIEVGSEDIASVVRRARGSARDALSVLDQIAAGAETTGDEVALSEVIAYLASGEVGEMISAFDRAVRSGRDAPQLAVELIERLRTDFLTLVGATSLGVKPTETGEVLAELGAARCVRAMDLIGSAITSMRDAPDPRVSLEIALIRAARPDADTTTEAVIDRLERLERELEDLRSAMVSRSVPETPPPPATRPRARATTTASKKTPDNTFVEDTTPSTTPPAAAPTPSVAPAKDEEGKSSPAPSRDDLVAAWGDEILPTLRPKLRAIYQVGRFVAAGEEGAVLALPNQAHLDHAEPLKGEISDALSRRFGRPVGLRLVTESSPEAQRVREPKARTIDTPHEVEEDGQGTDEDALVAEAREAAHEEPRPGVSAEKLSGLDLAEDRLLEAFPGAEEV